HRRDEAMEKWKTKNRFSTFPLPTICLLLPNSERRPGGGASLLLQAHCSIRICFLRGGWQPPQVASRPTRPTIQTNSFAYAGGPSENPLPMSIQLCILVSVDAGHYGDT